VDGCGQDWGVQLINTNTAYHPLSNGMVERAKMYRFFPILWAN
jgi:hypothetical protein